MEETLKNLIHREMRAHFIWHELVKFEKKGNGYNMTIAVKAGGRDYVSATNLAAALRKHYKSVRLTSAVNYSTIGNGNIYAFSISCSAPKILQLPVVHSQGGSLQAA